MPTKFIKMRDPKEIDEPIKTMRNPQTKLLRQATPEEIAGAIAKIDSDKKKAKKKAAEKAEAGPSASASEAAAAAQSASANEAAASAQSASASEAEAESAAAQSASASEAAEAAAVVAIEQNFYWINHAESVANLYNNEETDKYKDAAVQKDLDAEKVKFRVKDSAKAQSLFLTSGGAVTGEEPIVRTPGKYPLINELKEWSAKLVSKDKGAEITTYMKSDASCKPETYNYKRCATMIANKYKKKEEAQFAYTAWLMDVPFYSFFQPTLSQGGMVQARILGEQLKKKDIKPDVLLCAATVPAMMTAYLTARYAELPDTLIYIVPYINEKENEEAKKAFEGSSFHDFANYGISPVVIADVGDEIIKWFDNAKIYDKDNAAPANILPSTTPPRFDYTYYQGGDDEVRDSAATTTFFEWLDKTPLKEKPNVWVFSYDTPIKEIRKQALAGAIEDTIPLWNTNTAVFQHKRQGGTALQAIFPKDAPPKLTIPFPEELAAGGLIYYPNAGTQDTMIRAKKTALMAMDKTEEKDPLTSLEQTTGLRGQIAAITHGENLADVKSAAQYAKDLKFRLDILDEKFKTKIPNYEAPPFPPELTTEVEKTAFLTKKQTEYDSEKENINKMIQDFKIKLKEVETEKKIDPLLDEMVKVVEEQLTNVIKKYTTSATTTDKKEEDKKKIMDKFTEDTNKKLNELHDLIIRYQGQQKTTAQSDLVKEIKKLKDERKAVQEDNVSDKVLNDYKTRFEIKGGGGSRKKRSRKAKKSVRKNRKKERKHNSRKKKKGGRKYTKRNHNL